MSHWGELTQAVARAKLASERVKDKALGVSREAAKKNFDVYDSELDEIYGKDRH